MKVLEFVIIVCFFPFCVTSQTLEKTNSFDTTSAFRTIKANEKKFKLTKSYLFKKIQIAADSSEVYSTDKSKSQITSAKVIQNKSAKHIVISFWFLQNQLFKVTYFYSEMGYNNLKGKGYYFFSNNSVIYKEEKNISALDVNDLVVQSKVYFLKGLTFLRDTK